MEIDWSESKLLLKSLLTDRTVRAMSAAVAFPKHVSKRFRILRSVSSVPLNWKASVSSDDQSSSHTQSWVRWVCFCGLALTGTALDLITKQVIFNWRGLPGENPPFWLIEPYVGIETAVNPGALFGMGAGFGLGFAALSVLAAVAIVVWLARYRAIDSWWLLIALGCVMSGIFGNLYDRLGLWNPPAQVPEWSSGVRDWILLRYQDRTWPNFNIADSLLVCGAIMLAYHSFFLAADESNTDSDDAKDTSVGKPDSPTG